MLEGALFLLGVAFLATAGLLRARRGAASGQFERHWTGAAFDTSRVAARIHKVRQNYIVQLQSRDLSPGFHDQLLACAREAVKSLSYFKRRAMPGVPPGEQTPDG